MSKVELAKKICKEHGVKGFRKLNLKRLTYVAGKQCNHINKNIAKRLLDTLIENGIPVDDKATCYQLAEKGLLDTITLR